ncbi:hypothetical protein N5D_05300 [Enterococcus faecalis]|nr:hypothetical protein N4E_11090 [Enterococcus faecalis]GMC16559.1 hypothetical protein N5D_05300 [Enterococcus faecalis]
MKNYTIVNLLKKATMRNKKRSGQKRLTPRNKKEFPKIVIKHNEVRVDVA